MKKTLLLSHFLCLVCLSAVSGNEISPLVSGWSFMKGDPALDEEEVVWKSVTIPHTWNAVDALDGGGKDKQSRDGYDRGPGWYRKFFEVEQSLKGKRLFIRFEGVGSVADVYLNGSYLGQHRGAFGAFCFEITDVVHYGGENELKVRADNSWQADVAPLSGDFPVFGGMYRPVSLLVKGQVCITPLDHASPGIFITQKQVGKERAVVEVLTKIDNAGGPADLEIQCSIKDDAGAIVASNTEKVRVEENVSVTQVVTLENPRLWSGRKDPYLYSVEIDLMKDGTVIDSSVQPLGLRYFYVDPERGFFLNGEPYRLYGVNRHQDRPGKGWAISDADRAEDVALICEIGARTVRLAHYPNSSHFYELCDQAGLLVWAELPLVDCITAGPEFAGNARMQLIELVRQHYNHPSIFCWSLFNEMYHRDSPDAMPLLTELNAVCKEEDPGRLTASAVNRRDQALCNVTDLLAFNAYPGWYGGSPKAMGKQLESYNELVRHRGVAVSEYGAGASIYQHEQNPAKPEPNSHWHPEEWQAIVHENNYATIERCNYCWGSFVWNMFDFASVWRDEGDSSGMNDKGLVTYDRKVPKDAFFFYKANWSDEPVLYITSRRHVNRREPLTPVKVYSNAERVTLRVNGQEIGTTGVDDLKIARWDEVRLDEGENTIQVEATMDGQKVADSCIWRLNSTPSDNMK